MALWTATPRGSVALLFVVFAAAQVWVSCLDTLSTGTAEYVETRSTGSSRDFVLKCAEELLGSGFVSTSFVKSLRQRSDDWLQKVRDNPLLLMREGSMAGGFPSVEEVFLAMDLLILKHPSYLAERHIIGGQILNPNGKPMCTRSFLRFCESWLASVCAVYSQVTQWRGAL